MSSTPTVAAAPVREATRVRLLRWLAYGAPLLIAAALLAIYLVSPEFYLAYVLEYQHREYQAVEMTTVAFAAAASVLLFYAAWRLGGEAQRAQAAPHPPPTLHQAFDRWLPTLLVLVLALACFFLVGEELSWGQTFKYWGVAENQKPRLHETNLHNNLDLPLQSVGQIFLMCIFFVVPIIWRFRRRLNLPQSWGVIVAEGPVVFAAAVAFLWKGVKEGYVGLYGAADDDAFYWGFIEQINEQKELLIALSLLLYARYRVQAVRTMRRTSP